MQKGFRVLNRKSTKQFLRGIFLGGALGRRRKDFREKRDIRDSKLVPPEVGAPADGGPKKNSVKELCASTGGKRGSRRPNVTPQANA